MIHDGDRAMSSTTFSRLVNGSTLAMPSVIKNDEAQAKMPNNAQQPSAAAVPNELKCTKLMKQILVLGVEQLPSSKNAH